MTQLQPKRTRPRPIFRFSRKSKPEDPTAKVRQESRRGFLIKGFSSTKNREYRGKQTISRAKAMLDKLAQRTGKYFCVKVDQWEKHLYQIP